MVRTLNTADIHIVTIEPGKAAPSGLQITETGRKAEDAALILIDYQPKQPHRVHGTSDFLDATEPYSEDEQLMLAGHVAFSRFSTPATRVGIWSVAKPARNYPAYSSAEDASERFANAAHLMNTAGFDALVLNLNINPDYSRSAADEYARITQATNWARAALPHIEIIPSIDLSHEDYPMMRGSITAWSQACYDCAVSEVLIWAPPTDPTVQQAFDAGCK